MPFAGKSTTNSSMDFPVLACTTWRWPLAVWMPPAKFSTTARPSFRQIHTPRFAVSIESDLAHLERREGNDEKAEAIYLNTIQKWQEFGTLAAVANQLESLAFIAVHKIAVSAGSDAPWGCRSYTEARWRRYATLRARRIRPGAGRAIRIVASAVSC